MRRRQETLGIQGSEFHHAASPIIEHHSMRNGVGRVEVDGWVGEALKISGTPNRIHEGGASVDG